MAKTLFPDHERYLLENWADVVRLEDSVRSARETHAKKLEEALHVVRTEHPELNAQATHLEYPRVYDVNIGVGKTTWPAYNRNWPSGFWFGDIRIEDLTLEDEEPPYACVYLGQKEPDRRFLDDVANTIFSKLGDALASGGYDDPRKNDCGDPDRQRLIWWPLPDSRGELFALLLQDDARGFVRKIAEHMGFMTRFIPAMDDVFKSLKRNRR
jgi:hypothetical protein